MARLFNGLNDRAECTTLVNTILGTSGTISVWCKPNWNFNDGAGHYLYQYSDGSVEFAILHWTDNNIQVGWWKSGTDNRIIIASTSAMFSSGVWTNHVVTWTTAPATTYYAGGVSKGSNLKGAIANTIADCAIGNAAGGGGPNPNATLGEFAAWSVALTQAEITALALGVSARKIRPALITQFVPVWGLASPEPDLSGSGKVFTLTGTTLAAGPPVAMFTPRWWVNSEVAAAPSAIFRKTASRIGTRTGTRQTWAA